MGPFVLSTHQAVISRFQASVNSGQHWYLALLEAMRDYPENEYLIGGEALDWKGLAASILRTAGDILPQAEATCFIEGGKPPLHINSAEARQLIGESKYNMYLNYLYGVTVEAALLKAVTAEVVKERFSLGLSRLKDAGGEAIVRVYGAEKLILRSQYVQQAQAHAIGTPGFDAGFTYWLFKYRLKQHDKEKVASDTKKALGWLKNNPRSFPRLF